MKFPTTLLVLISVSIMHSCTTDTVNQGGSSETVNVQLSVSDTTVYVQIEDNNSSYSMEIFSPDYRPDYKYGYSSTAEPGGSDALRWSAPGMGNYNILIHNESKNTACFITGLPVGNDTTYTISSWIAPTRSLQGVLAKHDSTLADEQYVIAVPGSPFFTVSNKQSNFTLNHIPHNTFTLNVRPVETKLFSSTVQYLLPASILKTTSGVRLVIP